CDVSNVAERERPRTRGQDPGIRSALREALEVRIAPRVEEARAVGLLDERPDATAEARAERGRGGRAQLARRTRQEDRFRHLVAERLLRQRLRPVHGAAE